ncbi:MAG: SDR family oxidoreductase [Peptococcaceae bacterium]|nr:SDR family oxidoreductase [Peptococcaceae bacterium]
MAESIQAMFSLAGKVALITGASRGIGEEIAGVYLKAGARVAICSRKPEGVKDAVERLKLLGSQDVLGIAADVFLPEDRKKLVEAVMDQYGRIDILVNNAGANPSHGPLADLTEEAWDKVIGVNLKAPLFLSQSVYHAWMKAHGGVIINVASVGGFLATPGINAYNISKAGLIHLTRCLANEWGQDGVRVNAIAPGLIKTKFSRVIWDGPAGPEMVERHPISRIGKVEDIAGAALLLASDASSFMTGHTLIIDGGQLLCVSG